MSSPSDNSNRQIIPRWRAFTATTKLGELNSASNVSLTPFQSSVATHTNYFDWKSEPSLWNALDLIGSAIVSDEIAEVQEALQQVHDDPATPGLAKNLLNELTSWQGGFDSPAAPPPIGNKQIYTEIRNSKQRLIHFPWDAVEWIELARNYTTLGVRRKAERSILAALQIAPENRFVLRSAARFFVHLGDLDRAQQILFRTANNMRDPWLLASEIAVASAMGRTSNLAKVGQTVLRRDLSPTNLSELASALGTLEAESGNQRGAKKLLRQAIQGANENSVAQIEWLNRNRLGEVVDTSSANPPLLNEAHAWNAYLKGQWDLSLSNALKWLRDQPFSSHPAILSTYLLSDIMQKYQQAEEIGALALRANPNEPMLLNNYAFALVNIGKLTNAEQILRQINIENLTGPNRLIVATVGLLEFRMGNHLAGRFHYLDTIQEANEANDKVWAARAAIYLAMEELRAQTTEIETAIKRALELSRDVDSPEVTWQLGQLNSLAKQYTSNSRRPIESQATKATG